MIWLYQRKLFSGFEIFSFYLFIKRCWQTLYTNVPAKPIPFQTLLSSRRLMQAAPLI